jgi:hypothetical protein
MPEMETVEGSGSQNYRPSQGGKFFNGAKYFHRDEGDKKD